MRPLQSLLFSRLLSIPLGASGGEELQTRIPLIGREWVAGGGSCTHDIDCGWLPQGLYAEAIDRRALPSGTGARCVVGRCFCSNEFENKYGCSRCTVQMLQHYDYSSGLLEYSTRLRNKQGQHYDLCDLPVGGEACDVGVCERDGDNFTTFCPGDEICSVAGVGTGICIGADEGKGHCVCARDHFCRDCSLHLNDVLGGAHCNDKQPVLGGALCNKHSQCSAETSTTGYCTTALGKAAEVEGELALDNMQVNESELPIGFCTCLPGYSCRRCSLAKVDLLRGAKCVCDAPMIKYTMAQMKLEVFFTSPPWDSGRDCEVFYIVERVAHMPTPPLWLSADDAMEVLRTNGTKEQFSEDGETIPYVVEHGPLDPKKKNSLRPELYYIWAVSIPKSGVPMLASKVVRTGEIFLNGDFRLVPLLPTACLLMMGVMYRW